MCIFSQSVYIGSNCEYVQKSSPSDDPSHSSKTQVNSTWLDRVDLTHKNYQRPNQGLTKFIWKLGDSGLSHSTQKALWETWSCLRVLDYHPNHPFRPGYMCTIETIIFCAGFYNKSSARLAEADLTIWDTSTSAYSQGLSIGLKTIWSKFQNLKAFCNQDKKDQTLAKLEALTIAKRREESWIPHFPRIHRQPH